MPLPRVAIWILLAAMMILVANTAHTQDYPNKPIRIVTSLPGGSGDFLARLIAQGISGSLGQQVIVDNRPGQLTGGIVAKAQPDGYTLLSAGSTMAFAPLLGPTTYDTIKDFSPITRLGTAANVLVVHPSVPANSVKELIALAKAKPGELNYATAGTGSSYHLAGELFKSMAGVNIVRIPYASGGPAIIGLIGGQTQMSFGTAVAVAPHVKSGKLRALGVTSAKPTALAPGLPTIAASGLPGYEIVAVDFALAPAKTPASIIKRLNQEIARLLNQADIKEKIFNLGEEADPSSPEELAASMKSEMAKIAKLIKDAGIKSD